MVRRANIAKGCFLWGCGVRNLVEREGLVALENYIAKGNCVKILGGDAIFYLADIWIC